MNRVKSSMKKCIGKKNERDKYTIWLLQLYMGKELNILPAHKLNICQQHVAVAKEVNAILGLSRVQITESN